jgi:hypothetical protein
MKTVLLILSAAMVGGVFAADSTPTAFSKERYDETRGKSPFAEETLRPVVGGPEREIDNWVLTGMGELDDGRTWVAVRKVGADRSMTFTGSEPNDQGISIVKVNWGAEWKDSSVVLRQKGEESEIKFSKDSQPVVMTSEKNKRTIQLPPPTQPQTRPQNQPQVQPQTQPQRAAGGAPAGARQRERGGSAR